MRWRLVDRLIACEPGRSAVAVKSFARDEPLFEDHFPGFPTVPGALQIEMIAATGGKTLQLARPDRFSMLAAVKSAKFYRRIEPEEECLIRVTITQLSHGHAAAEGEVEVDGERASRATLLYALVDPPHSSAADPVVEEWLERAAGGPGAAE